MDTRTERVVLETDRYRIAGNVTLPSEGYRSRFSDYLNRGDIDFLPMTEAVVTPLDGTVGESERIEFIAVSRRHVRIAYPQE